MDNVDDDPANFEPLEASISEGVERSRGGEGAEAEWAWLSPVVGESIMKPSRSRLSRSSSASDLNTWSRASSWSVEVDPIADGEDEVSERISSSSKSMIIWSAEARSAESVSVSVSSAEAAIEVNDEVGDRARLPSPSNSMNCRAIGLPEGSSRLTSVDIN